MDVITGWLSRDCCVGFGCQDNYAINTDSELRLIIGCGLTPATHPPITSVLCLANDQKKLDMGLNDGMEETNLCSKFGVLDGELIKSVKTC